MLYPFGANVLVHIPAVQQKHKLDARAIECKLLKLLLTGGWLLWEPNINKMVQSASVIFPKFQSSNMPLQPPIKGSLQHIVNTTFLGEVPTEKYFKSENREIDSIFLVKDISVPNHLGQALSGAHQDMCRAACRAELDQMIARDIWEVLPKQPCMKTIGHCWVFDLKSNLEGTMEKFKARLAARGDKQQPGIDGAKMYAPTASLMLLCLLLGTAVLKGWKVASFDVSGTYLYIPVDKCVLIKPPVAFLPVLRLKKALYGMRQVGSGNFCLVSWIAWASLQQRWINHFTSFATESNNIRCEDFGPDPLSIGHWITGVPWFIIKLGDAPILWTLKRQLVVALSTCAAEYVALSNSMQHFVQAINQLTQLTGNFDKLIFCNNQAAVQVSINKSRKRMRYLDQAFFFVNGMIRKHGIKVTWVKMVDMQASALTKRLLGLKIRQALPFLGIIG
ncbi:hypothetical protein O181_000852 [Austropuccinia psidii MF-1]|uniref:Reverse transcriptase Ty1/copia-type domain-containing protein n=1 Tax=Austropuccinia psidii MF-1 TaxID=1389203 RepID=A0A9Q3B9G2_9BASI|nr:hypothetical protein [Austropuccinia psidii MF-1]